MTFKNLSVKRLFGWIVAGLFLSMAVITLSLFFITKQTAVLLTGGVLLLCALIWLFSADADIWKTIVRIYFCFVPNSRPHD